VLRQFDIPADVIQWISFLLDFALGMASATRRLATVYQKIAHVHLGMGDLPGAPTEIWQIPRRNRNASDREFDIRKPDPPADVSQFTVRTAIAL